MFRNFLVLILACLWTMTGIGAEIIVNSQGEKRVRLKEPSKQEALPCPPPSCCPPPPAFAWDCNPRGCSNMDGNGAYVSADFLYWSAQNQSFSYAYDLSTTTPLDPNNGSIVRIDPDWDPGFRIGIGWNTNYDYWDVLLNYTWFRSFSSETRISSNAFIPLWPVTIAAGVEYKTVSASARFLLNMGDLEMGRWIYLTKSMAIRPHWGIRGGGIRQQFADQFSQIALGEAVEAVKFLGQNNYWGVGPRTGISGEWHLSRGFSILGKAAGALLYGKTIANSLSSLRNIADQTFSTNREYSDVFFQLAPNLQISLGFQWQTCLWCEKMLFKMSAAWETNCWWNMFALPYGLFGVIAPTTSTINFPLTMEGLTVNFEWAF